MSHILMVGMPTLQLGGHIIALGRLLHKSFRIFPGILGLWQEMGESIFGKTCGGGTNLWDPNIQDYSEQSQLKIFSYHQFLVPLVPSLETLISVVIFPILRQKDQSLMSSIVCLHFIPINFRCEILVFIFFRVIYNQVFFSSLVSPF